jgi:hypothetical protein
MLKAWRGCLLVIAACRSGSLEAPQVPAPPPPSAALASVPRHAGGLTWDAMPPLLARVPKTQLRAAEYSVAGDTSAELLVFYFGNEQSGSVDANVQRWLAQIEQADGSDSASKAKRAELRVSGLPVSTLEVSGVYTGPMVVPGAVPGATSADSLLLGAIVSGPKGPVFFKLTGPRASIESARSAFEQLVRSVRPE